MTKHPTPGFALAAGLFLAAACLTWLPFHTQSTLYESRAGGSIPAGQIIANFGLSQSVTPPILGANTDIDGLEHCFGIRFATYQRTNRGHLRVDWQQDGRRANWRVAAGDLEDNTFRYFCPDAPFSAGQPFDLKISGVDGEPGRAATLWMVDDTRLGQAVSDTGTVSDKALALEVTARKRIDLPTMLGVNHGAFLLGWICTLLVGVVTLVFAFGQRRQE